VSVPRSVLAIVAGFASTVVLALGTDFAVRSSFPASFDSSGATQDPAFLLAGIAYTAVFGVVGSFVAARSAPSRPLLHALILGGIAFAISVAAQASRWATGPVWYHLAAVVFVLPSAWLGGWLRERQT
jgi:hypothetical protein